MKGKRPLPSIARAPRSLQARHPALPLRLRPPSCSSRLSGCGLDHARRARRSAGVSLLLTGWQKRRSMATPLEQTFTISRPTGRGSATRRLALIVGNAKYPVNPLRNAVNDASDMHEALKKLGFETQLLTNATFEQMEDAIDAFS